MAKMIIDIPDNMQEMCKWHKEGICDLTNIEIYILVEAIIKGTQFSGEEWIPVSERLPNMDKYKSGAIWERSVLATVYHSWDSHKELYITMVFAEDVIIGYHIDECIVAWMPLPVPFEPQESEVSE